VSHEAKNAAAATNIRDSMRRRRPAVSAITAPTTRASDAARPKVPVRSDWSATRPKTTAQASVIQVACQRVFVVAHAGSGAATGCHAAPSHRQRPSGES